MMIAPVLQGAAAEPLSTLDAEGEEDNEEG
jgi:hypothetical protein